MFLLQLGHRIAEAAGQPVVGDRGGGLVAAPPCLDVTVVDIADTTVVEILGRRPRRGLRSSHRHDRSRGRHRRGCGRRRRGRRRRGRRRRGRSSGGRGLGRGERRRSGGRRGRSGRRSRSRSDRPGGDRLEGAAGRCSQQIVVIVEIELGGGCDGTPGSDRRGGREGSSRGKRSGHSGRGRRRRRGRGRARGGGRRNPGRRGGRSRFGGDHGGRSPQGGALERRGILVLGLLDPGGIKLFRLFFEGGLADLFSRLQPGSFLRAGATKTFRSPGQVALEGTLLDLPQDPGPVLGEGGVALEHLLVLEALPRVADVLAPQDLETTLQLFATTGWLEAFDPGEVLIVQHPEFLESFFELSDGYIDLGSIHKNLKILQPRSGRQRPLTRATG